MRPVEWPGVSCAPQGRWPMDALRHLSVSVLVGLVLLPAPASGQGLTGALVGTVKDAHGGVIPGAVVRVTSPALLGGERHTTTSDRGQWRVPLLPSGEYVLAVEVPSKFAPYEEKA